MKESSNCSKYHHDAVRELLYTKFFHLYTNENKNDEFEQNKFMIICIYGTNAQWIRRIRIRHFGGRFDSKFVFKDDRRQ